MTVRLHIRHQVHQARKAMQKARRECHAHEVHQFRVSVKRLNARLRMFGLQLPQRIKRMYKAAGKIRNIQLQMAPKPGTPHTGPLPAGYTAFLQRRLERYHKQFRQLATTDSLARLARKIRKKVHRSVTEDDLSHYLESLWLDFRTITMHEQPTDDALHECRKTLKHMLYTDELYRESTLLSKGGLLPDTTQKKLSSLGETLGRYIDSTVSLALLKKYLPKCADVEERAILETWQERSRQERELLYHQIIPSVPRVLLPGNETVTGPTALLTH